MNILESLYDDLQGEVSAIKMYQSHIDCSDNPFIQEALSEILHDEKNHVGILLTLINEYDETFIDAVLEGQDEIEELLYECVEVAEKKERLEESMDYPEWLPQIIESLQTAIYKQFRGYSFIDKVYNQNQLGTYIKMSKNRAFVDGFGYTLTDDTGEAVLNIVILYNSNDAAVFYTDTWNAKMIQAYRIEEWNLISMAREKDVKELMDVSKSLLY